MNKIVDFILYVVSGEANKDVRQKRLELHRELNKPVEEALQRNRDIYKETYERLKKERDEQ